MIDKIYAHSNQHNVEDSNNMGYQPPIMPMGYGVSGSSCYNFNGASSQQML